MFEIQYITYMTLFLTKNFYFRTKKFLHYTFLVTSYFATHPITLLQLLGRRMHGPSSQLKFFGGTVPQSLPKSPSMVAPLNISLQIYASAYSHGNAPSSMALAVMI